MFCFSLCCFLCLCTGEFCLFTSRHERDNFQTVSAALHCGSFKFCCLRWREHWIIDFIIKKLYQWVHFYRISIGLQIHTHTYVLHMHLETYVCMYVWLIVCLLVIIYVSLCGGYLNFICWGIENFAYFNYFWEISLMNEWWAI